MPPPATSRSPLPNRRISLPASSSTHPMTLSESSRYVPTDVISATRNSSCDINVEESLTFPALSTHFGAAREGKTANPWGKPAERVTSTATDMASYSSGSSRAKSLSQEDLERSLSSVLPSLDDSDELSAEDHEPVGPLHSSVTPEPGMMASSLDNDFQPLSKHSRSKSDPQVAASEQESEFPFGKERTRIPLSHLSRTRPFSASIKSPSTEVHKSLPLLSPENVALFAVSTSKVTLKGSAEGEEESTKPSQADSGQGSDSPAVSQEDLDSAPKTTKSIAVIQPTQVG